MRLALATALALTLPCLASADPIDDAIKARQAYFTLLGANIGPLAAMAKGEIDYDAESAGVYSGNLAVLANVDIVPFFPPASSNEDKTGKTRALPAIWTDTDGFIAKYQDFAAAAKALVEPAAGGRETLGPALGKLGGTCKACHDDYRAKDF